jgi:VanZ family protein
MCRIQLPLVPRWLRLAGVVAVAATILYYSVFTPPGSGVIRMGPFGVFPYSTWLHVLAYAGLAVALAYAFQDSAWRARSVLLIVVLLTVGYGGSIELLQSTLAGRTASVGDLLTNAVGAGVAAACWWVVTRRVRFYQMRRIADFEAPIR